MTTHLVTAIKTTLPPRTRWGILLCIVASIVLPSPSFGRNLIPNASSPIMQRIFSIPKWEIVVYNEPVGYNLGSVCVFADLVKGYALPNLGPRFSRDRKHFRSLPGNAGGDGKVYEFVSGTITGRVVDKGSYAYFEYARLDAGHIPESFRQKSNILAYLEVSNVKSVGDFFELSCDTDSVTLHFMGGNLYYVEIKTWDVD